MSGCRNCKRLVRLASDLRTRVTELERNNKRLRNTLTRLRDIQPVPSADARIAELEQQVADAEFWALTNTNVFRSASIAWANAPHGPNRVRAFWEKLHIEREARDFILAFILAASPSARSEDAASPAPHPSSGCDGDST